ncbi:MAG: hypothetical protein PHG61_06880 [Candidatus Marinimicrobia bacterium]|nr:hypothetical protein [Candidatus Neomarinimicrobiota bacterium]
MTGSIIPTHLPAPNTILGYNDADFYPLYMDVQSAGKRSQRVSLPVDRSMTDVSLNHSADYAAHGETVRATYTVPSAKRALLQAVFTRVSPYDTGSYAGVIIKIDGIPLVWFVVDVSISVVYAHQTIPFYLWLNTGQVVTLSTYSLADTTITLTGSVHLREFAG